MHIAKENRNKISAYKQRIFAIRHDILEKICKWRNCVGSNYCFLNTNHGMMSAHFL